MASRKPKALYIRYFYKYGENYLFKNMINYS